MTHHEASLSRVLTLAAITGLRTTFGPALVAAAHRRPERDALALAALGEIVVDKLPITPSRARPSMMLPRALAGYWVAKKVMEEDGLDSTWAAPAGAAVAAGVALVAPRVRNALQRKLGVPDALLGFAEDAVALAVGSQAVGLSSRDVRSLGGGAVEQLKEGRVGPAFNQIKGRVFS